MKTGNRAGAWLAKAAKTSLVVALFAQASVVLAQTSGLIDEYVERWVDFYPSAAFGEGLALAALRFEDYSDERLAAWIDFNRETERVLSAVPATAPLDERVDARVLLRQVRGELERWTHDDMLSKRPQWYANQVSNALTHVLISEKLGKNDLYDAVTNRLAGVRALCDLGIARLVDGNPGRTESALKILEQTAEFYEHGLLGQASGWTPDGDSSAFRAAVGQTTERIRALAGHLRDSVLPKASLPGTYGRETYARKLAIFSDGALTPDNLPPLALAEIDTVRGLMLEVAAAWWAAAKPGEEAPAGQALIEAALDAMEEDRAATQQELLRVFKTAVDDSMAFLERHALASLPDNREVIVDLMPEHSPMARVGGVFPPGPFDPAARTLLYLPSVPDDAPPEVRDGFYRSFNNHFNRMIVSHEIFPGHAMQFIVGLDKASKVRGLFSNQYYSEGWASFSEVLMLEAGWGGGNPLTRLAHLRKRLENATRAYISVMVHAEGWDRDRVIEFARTRGWLPEQFAKNLWNRAADLYLSLQLTSYFVGYHGFDALWADERQRLGDAFDQRAFVDAVLATGSVPMDMLGELVKRQAIAKLLPTS